MHRLWCKESMWQLSKCHPSRFLDFHQESSCSRNSWDFIYRL
jgi:hypothetical protein